MANDLLDAVIATLENDTTTSEAFGDTWNQTAQTGVAKFFSDVVDQVAPPYAVLTEIGEGYDYQSRVAGGVVPFICTGQMQIDIWATGRYQTRTLGFDIAKTLNDAPLAWPLESTMEFRLMRSMYVPVPGQTGSGSPTMFHRIFIFEYVYSGAL